MDEDPANTTSSSGDDEDYIIALIVGIPCGLIIIVLLVLIFIMFYLTIKSRLPNQEEGIYRQRRFKGITLEEQREMARAKRKAFLPKKITSRRKSTEAAQVGVRALAVPSRNPFRLQEWQLRMSGIGVPGGRAGGVPGDPETDETELEGEEEEVQKTVYGAINPLMMGEDDEGDHPRYMYETGSQKQADSDEESSSDSFNPYD